MENLQSTKRQTLSTILFLYIILRLHPTVAIQLHSLPFFAHPKATFVRSESILVDSSQVFGFCQKVAHKNTDDLCNFYIETNDNLDSRDHVRNCNFILKPYQTSGSKRLIAIDNDRAILRVTSRFTTLSILNFSECKMTPIRIQNSPLKVRYANIYAPFIRTFDLIVYGQNGFCEGRGACKYVADFDGNIVMGNERLWIKGSDVNFKAMIHTKMNGRMIVETYEQTARVKGIDQYGFLKVLKEYPIEVSKDFQTSKVSASATHHRISLCSLVNSTAMCSQYNFSEVVEFDKKFHLDESKNCHSIRVHNLHGGGILLLVFECSDESNNCEMMRGDFVVHKIDVSGRRIGSLKVTQLQCIDGEFKDDIRFFFSKENAMCLSMICDTFLINERVSLDLACFNDEDFDT